MLAEQRPERQRGAAQQADPSVVRRCIDQCREQCGVVVCIDPAAAENAGIRDHADLSGTGIHRLEHACRFIPGGHSEIGIRGNPIVLAHEAHAFRLHAGVFLEAQAGTLQQVGQNRLDHRVGVAPAPVVRCGVGILDE